MDFKHILCLPILLLLFPIVYGLKILKNSKTNICPNGNGPEWSNMASMVDRKYCSEEEKYHCVQTQIGNYTELCIEPIRIDKGYHPEYSEAVKRLYPRQCSNDYFQENDMWSDEFRTVTCSMMKSLCDGEGEYRCHNGSPTSNRECGCNHTAGYRVQQFYAEYLKQTCFNPLYQHGDCIYLPCEKKHEELNEVYECVPKRGYNSPPPTKPTSETSSVPALMTKDLDKTGISVAKQPLKDHSIDVLYIAVPLSCVGVLLIVIVGLYFICRGKPLCSGNDIKCCINIQGGDIQFGEKNTMENNMQLEPLLPADDDHNERNEQRTPVHIDHSVPPSPCQEDGTLRSMKDTIDMFTARIRPEFHIPPDIDKYLTPSHGLYFSLLYLLKIYYREKFSSIRSAFEFYKKVSLYLDLNEFPKLTLDGFAYKSAENEKFACEKIVREISDKYQVPITVISVLDSDNIQKTQCFTSHPSNQSSSAMPCIYLGCLENEAKSFFFVPLISSSSDTEEDGSSLDSTNIGECLKKEEDDVDNYLNYVNLLKANVSDSIAFIKVTGSGTGSGYQVGPRYVVTALHVVKDVFRNMWRTIFQELKGKNEEMLKSPDFPIKIKLDKWEEYQQSFDLSVFVEDGVWPLGYLKVENVIKYLKDNNKCKLADKIKKQAKNIIFDCQVEFGKIDTEQRKPYHIHFDMAYGNSEEDIAVLELDENTDKIPFRRFLMLSLKKTINKVHVLGHPAGKVLQFDPSCSVVENGKELCSLQNDAIDFFTGSKFTPALDKDMQEDVKKEYKAMSLQRKDMFMQCSKSFAKGSSGGPCLIYDETRKAPVVVGTILRGIPYIYFNGFNEKQQEKSKQQPRFLLDKALTSWGLYELLEKIPKLQDEIYKEKDATTVDSDPIQAPKGPLEISEVKKGSVKLSWKKVPSNDTVKQYIIQRVECTKQEGSVPLNWDDCGVVPVENISKEDYCCVVNDLDEEREYLFRVFAKNSDNESGLYLQSIDGVIPKDPIPPPSMPNGPLNIEAKTQNSVILSWQQECTSCEYHIQMKTGDSEDWLNIDKTKNPPVEIPDIDPKKSSFFQIYAQNDGGRSEPLGCDENFNLKDLYLPPCFQGELQTTLRGDKAELKWNPLQEQPFYPVTEYEIYAYHAETKEHLTTVSPENITAYKTKRLNKGTKYIFSISAKNDIGSGKELKSKAVFIQGVPDPPTRTTNPVLEGTSIAIEWGAPVNDGGSPVTEYVVYSKCLNLGADRFQEEGTSWEKIATLNANTLQFVYDNFRIPSKCMLQILAMNSVGESDPLELGPVDVTQKECLKKEEDDTDNYLMYLDLQKANVSDSIAFIKVTGSHTGSGYRVGSRYVVTALHVIKDVIRNMWGTIFQELKGNDEEMLKSPDFPIKIKLDKWEEYQQNSDFDLSVFVQGGVWPLDYLKVENVTKYLKNNNKFKLADKIEKQAKSIISDCQVEFGKIDIEQRKPCLIHFDMAYGNSEEDIAILELDGNTDKIPFGRFLMLSLKKTINKVHVLGHPDGKVLQFDPSCSLVENDKELCSLQNDAIDFFTGSKFTPALNKDMQKDVMKEYQAMRLQHKDMFMHCSKSFAKGSSGSPCLIYDETQKAPVVVGTILRGIPYMYFNGFNKKQQEKSKQQPQFLLDKALTSWGLYKLLVNVPELRDDIYKGKDTTTVDSGVPDPPARTKDPVLEGTSIAIEWGAPVDDGGSPVTEYVVYSKCLCLGADRFQEEGTNWEKVATLDANTLRFVYDNFRIPSKCMLQIFAKNRVGKSDPLELGPVDVTQKGIPGPPVWTKHPVVKGATLEIEWGPPSDDGGSPVEEYVVYMMTLDENFQEEEVIGLIKWEEKARFNSETLKWNTNQKETPFKRKLKVVAITSMGESEPLYLEPVDI